jgi:hypothetical protein
MSYYIIADRSTGELIQVSSDLLTPADGQLMLSRDGDIPDLSKYSWSPQLLAFVETRANRFVTQEAFVRRLTTDELRAIYTLAKQSIDVEIWLDRFKMAKEIDLDDPNLIYGLYGLYQAGILTTERIEEVLS